MITGTGNGNIQYNKPYLIETRKIKYKGPGEVGNEKKKKTEIETRMIFMSH